MINNMSKKQIFRLNEIIGGLSINQWKGKKKQDEYRKAINTIRRYNEHEEEKDTAL